MSEVIPVMKQGQRFLILLVLCSALILPSAAQTFSTLAVFHGVNGFEPSYILQGADGKLWISSTLGGQSKCGTISKVNLAGKLATVLAFDCNTGYEPQGLTLGTDGNYYGTTFFAGTDNAGTVFKLTPSGSMTTLFNFSLSGDTLGADPTGTLVQGTDGNFYGATYTGGTLGYGTLFKITPSGTLTSLHDFDFTSGAQPYSSPIQGKDGNFYGTTYSGGTTGFGVIYKMTPQGQFTVLHYMDSSLPDGNSTSPLLQATDGNFYGMTYDGGFNGDGTIFKITPSGTFSTIHEFDYSDGSWPISLIQASDGKFYGTTAYGSTANDGTIFQMTSSGAITTLHSFGGSDGANAIELIQDTNGILYGVTSLGGDLNCYAPIGCGAVFSLDLSLKAFVKAVPTAAKVGASVIILGTELSGAQSVTFNGTPATFQVISASQIKATVPAGATTGKIQVVTSTGALSTNSAFRILP